MQYQLDICSDYTHTAETLEAETQSYSEGVVGNKEDANTPDSSKITPDGCSTLYSRTEIL